MHNLGRKIKYVVLLCIVFDIVWIGVKLSLAHNYQKKFDTLPPSGLDAGFVLYGSKSARPRIDAAVNAYSHKHIKNIVFIGGCRPQFKYFGAQDWADQIIKMGVPRDAVDVGFGSYDSYTNLENITNIVQTKGWGNVAIISDPMHLRRVMGTIMRDDKLKALRKATPIFSQYSDGLFTPFKRAQYEIIVDSLELLTTKKMFDTITRKYRLQKADVTQDVSCGQNITPQ